MEAIRQMLDAQGAPYADKHLGWGASVNDYRDEILNAPGDTAVYGIELTENMDGWALPGNYTRVDHHNDYSEKESSIRQVADIVGVELSREQQLIAANDSGYIPAMKAMGATNEEVADIRRRDRAAQGVTEEEERLAAEALKDNATRTENSVSVLVPDNLSHFSPITDTLYGTKHITVYNGKELCYYGPLAHTLGSTYKDDVEQGKMYYGGSPESGFFGTSDGAYSRTALISLEDSIAQAIRLAEAEERTVKSITGYTPEEYRALCDSLNKELFNGELEFSGRPRFVKYDNHHELELPYNGGLLCLIAEKGTEPYITVTRGQSSWATVNLKDRTLRKLFEDPIDLRSTENIPELRKKAAEAVMSLASTDDHFYRMFRETRYGYQRTQRANRWRKLHNAVVDGAFNDVALEKLITNVQKVKDTLARRSEYNVEVPEPLCTAVLNKYDPLHPERANAYAASTEECREVETKVLEAMKALLRCGYTNPDTGFTMEKPVFVFEFEGKKMFADNIFLEEDIDKATPEDIRFENRRGEEGWLFSDDMSNSPDYDYNRLIVGKVILKNLWNKIKERQNITSKHVHQQLHFHVDESHSYSDEKEITRIKESGEDKYVVISNYYHYDDISDLELDRLRSIVLDKKDLSLAASIVKAQAEACDTDENKVSFGDKELIAMGYNFVALVKMPCEEAALVYEKCHQYWENSSYSKVQDSILNGLDAVCIPFTDEELDIIRQATPERGREKILESSLELYRREINEAYKERIEEKKPGEFIPDSPIPPLVKEYREMFDGRLPEDASELLRKVAALSNAGKKQESVRQAQSAAVQAPLTIEERLHRAVSSGKIKSHGTMSDGWVKVEAPGGKFNYANSEGKFMTKNWFDTATDFVNGTAEVSRGDMAAKINKEGLVVSLLERANGMRGPK